MGIKLDNNTKFWEAWHSKRHPITNVPKSLRRKGIKSQAAAKRIEKMLVIQIEESFRTTLIPTWAEMVDKFLATKLRDDWCEKTHNSCSSVLKAHTILVWGDRRIDTFDGSEIRNFFAEKLEGKSASHRQYVLRYVRGVFAMAVENGHLSRNPCPRLKIEKGEKVKKGLTEEQVRILLEKAKCEGSEWYYHWVLAVYTGMRNGELYALTWDKVNMDQRLILVDSAWTKFDGFKATKSGDDRIVEIAPTLLRVLQELKMETTDPEFVLPRMRNWDKGEQARFLRMFLEGIGLPPVRFHDLRASWATIMLSKGIEPIKVMRMGGWKNLKTMQIYIRMAGVDISGITDGLELHNPTRNLGQVLDFSATSSSL